MNAGHVDNLDTIDKLQENGFTGPDASLETSLFEYGLAWRDLGDGKWLFVYGIAAGEVDGEERYTRFERTDLRESEFESDFDWCDFAGLAETSGIDLETWRGMPFTQRIADLHNYHGFENTFGESYWEGFAIAE